MKLTMTSRQLRGVYNALQVLANRFLPDMKSDLKVAALLREISKYAEPLQSARNKVAPKIAEMEGVTVANSEKLTPIAQTLFMAKLNEAYSCFDDTEVEVEYTDRLRISQNDLPKERTGEKGWENGSMIGAIVADLGDLFEYPKE
jgi:hypothetical protein